MQRGMTPHQGAFGKMLAFATSRFGTNIWRTIFSEPKVSAAKTDYTFRDRALSLSP
ncbi:hypothetical protein MESS4_580098 [Mesorhizobium sp. STM 4661]|nr:hypothetical protein MESS4_580098 [Mesorhizobium sp. STM 4661]